MFASSVQEGAAKTAIRPAVFAAVAFPTHREQQAVAKSDAEVAVWHGAYPFKGGQQERAGCRAPVRAGVSSVSLRHIAYRVKAPSSIALAAFVLIR